MVEFGSLNCVYFVLFVLGVGYAVISALLGGLADFHLPGVDIDIPGVDLHPGGPDLHLEVPFTHDLQAHISHSEVGLSPLSPITIATFVTSFGGMGLILSNLTKLPPFASATIAAVFGLADAAVMFVVYGRFLSGMQSSSEVRSGEVVGKLAEVVTPIAAEHLGEVSFVARGARVHGPARSEDGQAIARGTRVEIVEEAGNVLVVRQKQSRK